jgi:hypothetical protein
MIWSAAMTWKCCDDMERSNNAERNNNMECCDDTLGHYLSILPSNT